MSLSQYASIPPTSPILVELDYTIYFYFVLAGAGWVTSSEDHTIRVWSLAGEAETINVPSDSVWSVCVLPNSDIVAGTKYVPTVPGTN